NSPSRYFSDTTFLNSNENFSMHPQFLVWCLTFGAQFNNSGHMNVINTIFNALPTLFNTFKFDKKNMKPLLLANNSNEYPGLFSAIQHKQQNVVETVYLALSDHARLFGFTAEDIMDFWQHKAPQKYSAFELAFEFGHRVIAELILNTLNKMAESFGFTDNPRYIAEKNYMEALLKKASPHTVR
ncbi:hypothetical protein R1C39_23800, partial [Escherichia coli]